MKNFRCDSYNERNSIYWKFWSVQFIVLCTNCKWFIFPRHLFFCFKSILFVVLFFCCHALWWMRASAKDFCYDCIVWTRKRMKTWRRRVRHTDKRILLWKSVHKSQFHRYLENVPFEGITRFGSLCVCYLCIALKVVDINSVWIFIIDR